MQIPDSDYPKQYDRAVRFDSETELNTGCVFLRSALKRTMKRHRDTIAGDSMLDEAEKRIVEDFLLHPRKEYFSEHRVDPAVKVHYLRHPMANDLGIQPGIAFVSFHKWGRFSSDEDLSVLVFGWDWQRKIREDEDNGPLYRKAWVTAFRIGAGGLPADPVVSRSHGRELWNEFISAGYIPVEKNRISEKFVDLTGKSSEQHVSEESEKEPHDMSFEDSMNDAPDEVERKHRDKQKRRSKFVSESEWIARQTNTLEA